MYLNTEDGEDYLFDETVETDYPLHHFLSKILPWKLPLLTLWRPKHELQKQQTDSDHSFPGYQDWFQEPTREVVFEQEDSSREWIDTKIRRHNREVRRRNREFRRRNGGSDDTVESKEEESDLPRSRVRRVFGTVERLFRKKSRRRESPSSFEYSTESSSSDGNSDGVVVVNREDLEYRTPSLRSSRRTSNSDDIEIMEEESNDPPARSRASRILGPIERLFRRRDRDREERETASYEGSPDTEASSASRFGPARSNSQGNCNRSGVARALETALYKEKADS